MWGGGSGGSGLPGDGQLADAVDDGVLLERDLLHRYGDLQVGKPAEECGQDDLEFGAGQGLAEALVDAVAEGQVLAGGGPGQGGVVGGGGEISGAVGEGGGGG